MQGCVRPTQHRAGALNFVLLLCGCSVVPLEASSFWANSITPGTADVTSDGSGVTVGVEFYSDIPGEVTGVRFYKGTDNTGTHIGALWSSTGAKLASVTVSGETASGWQQANFSSPVAIAANTVYVVSYFAPDGNYADDQNYSWSTLSAAPLHPSGSSPGVYAYGSSNTFPNSTWNDSNYWVDLVFVSNTPATAYSISGHVTGSAAQLTLSGAASASTQTDSSGNYSFSGLSNGKYVVAPSESGSVFSPSTASETIKGGNVTGVNFTATASVAHSVSLSWTESATTGVSGYNVYRATTSGGPYTQLNGSLVEKTSYVDNNVSAGQTYYYVATAVNTSNEQSGYSNQAGAAVPKP